MRRLMIIGLWPDDAVNYCTEKCDCRRYAFDRILYHRGGRAARERICIPVVDRSGATTTYLDLPVTLLEAGVIYLRLDDGSDIFLSNTQMALIANEVERQRAECAGTVRRPPGMAYPRRRRTGSAGGGKSSQWTTKRITLMRGTCSLRTRHAHIFQTPEHDICGKATSYKRTA